MSLLPPDLSRHGEIGREVDYFPEYRGSDRERSVPRPIPFFR